MDINAVHLFRQIPTIKLKFTCPGFALLHIDNGFPDPLKIARDCNAFLGISKGFGSLFSNFLWFVLRSELTVDNLGEVTTPLFCGD